MNSPFRIRDLPDGCLAIDHRGRTVATVSSQGAVDWLLRDAGASGTLLPAVRKEVHLSHVQGLMLWLVPPVPSMRPVRMLRRMGDDGGSLTLTVDSVSQAGDGTADGRLAATTAATLAVDAAGNYAWSFAQTITCTADRPIGLATIEYNNVYPGRCGRNFLFADQKEFDCTLLTDRDGTVWRFPHQHLMHYSAKIDRLSFADGAVGGFFGSDGPCPTVSVIRSSAPPHWAICDMYYDLHCLVRPAGGELAPGASISLDYRIAWQPATEAAVRVASARTIPVDDADRARHDYPRLVTGQNRFNRPVAIDRPDDAASFRPRPPDRVWERSLDDRPGAGALRLINAAPAVNVWGMEPLSQIPPETRLKIGGMARVRDVTGKGFFLRLTYLTWVWRPRPHTWTAAVLESDPLTGTSDGWVRISLPDLRVPAEHDDFCIQLALVLDGGGTAWLTDLDIALGADPGVPAALAARAAGAR